VRADTTATIFLDQENKMKNFRGFALGLVLGLAAALSTVGIAQNATQSDQNQKTESCCARQSGCCKGDSCAMKVGKDHAKKDQSMTGSSKEGCCCCGGDSCNMKMKDMEHKQ
jgi:hypothetical protein